MTLSIIPCHSSGTCWRRSHSLVVRLRSIYLPRRPQSPSPKHLFSRRFFFSVHLLGLSLSHWTALSFHFGWRRDVRNGTAHSSTWPRQPYQFGLPRICSLH